MWKSAKSLLAAVLLAALTTPFPASAAWREATPSGFIMLAASYVPMDEAISKARKRANGRVLSTRLKERDGRQVYVVKILLPGGKVKRVVVDAVSGRVIR